MEEWKTIQEGNGDYGVSSYGRFKNVTTGKILASKYRTIRLVNGKGGKDEFATTDLFAKYFMREPINGEFLRFKDGDNGNMRVENMEWGTVKAMVECGEDVVYSDIGINGYQVSNYGDVWSNKGSRTLNRRMINGNLSVCLYVGKKSKIKYIHTTKYVARLVAEAFIRPMVKGEEVMCIDGDANNCRVDNIYIDHGVNISMRRGKMVNRYCDNRELN